MTPNNVVATISAVLAFLTALMGYLKQRQINKNMRATAYYTKGRFDDILEENRRLRAEKAPKEDTDHAGNP